MIIVLLPCYNEAHSIEILLGELKAALDEIGGEHRVIVGDDGSTDGTARVVLDGDHGLPLEVIRHRINRGLGETARDLFERAAEITGDDDVIVRMDGDNTHDPKYIPALVAALERGADVAIASRYEAGGAQHGVGWYRGLISKCANMFMGLVFPIRGLKEYSCGYRAYRAGRIRQAVRFYGNNFIQLRGLGFTGTLEKLVKLKLLGARFAEVPFELRYDRKIGPSKMVVSVTTVGYMVMALLYHWPFGGWKSQYKPRIRAGEAEGTDQHTLDPAPPEPIVHVREHVELPARAAPSERS